MLRSRNLLAALLAATLLSLAPASPAQAQVSLTDPVLQPGAGIADGAEPWAVVLNPAALTEARDWLIGLRDSEITGGAHPFVGLTGTGLYVARPLPYLRRFAFGGALELLRSSEVPRLAGKLTLDLAYQLAPWFSVGLSYAHVFAPQSTIYNNIDTVSLGARLTVSRFLAIGALFADLPAPQRVDPASASGFAIERSYEAELLLRPIGDHRLELAAGLRVGEASHNLWPRMRLWVRPTPGLSLGVDGTLAVIPDQALDYRIGFGLELNLANVGGSGFALIGSSRGSTGLQSGSAAVRISFERYPALWTGSERLYKIDLGARTGQSMLRLLAELRRLEHDRRARGVIVIANGLRGGWGVADELRDALVRLRAAGKRVFAYGADFSQREYYIATAAERIYLDPMGSISLGGIAYGGFFVKDALDRLGIRAELIRIGDYKSTPEMWTRSEPTEPARLQRQALIDDLFERLCQAVAGGRRLPRPAVDRLVERALFPASQALGAGLIDAIATGEQVEANIGTLVGEQLLTTSLEALPEHPTSYAPPGVAVVHIEGDLTDGRSRSVPFVDIRIAGGQTLSSALAEAGRNPQVRAVVLRIDSPGGSALTADVLARQVAELARAKPVICSFGDIAASGGYYLAAPCTLIYTNPSTTTGSIGIFGGKVDFSGLLAWLGVRRATLQRGSHADLESPYRPYSDSERAMVLERLRQGYERFLDVVARGRSMSRADVDARGQGRIWSGQQAVAQRLCDRTGGLMDAVTEARRRADLPDTSPLFHYPRVESSLLGQILGLPDLFGGGSESAAAAAAMPELERLLRSAGDLLPGLKTALLLLSSDVLARLDSEPPR